MYGTTNSADTAAEVERTAFRKAEKRYKLYKTPSLKSRAKQRQQTLSTDLSEVVDFAAVLNSYLRGEELPPGVYKFECSGFPHPVFCFQDRPGFYFIPGALSVEEQCHWISESLKSFPQPPNRTNHNAIYGPLQDLFLATQNQKVLVEIKSSTEDPELDKDSSVSNSQTDRYRFSENIPDYGGRYRFTPASELLRRLRWSTLGLQFNWSKRNYDSTFPHNKIPDALCFLAKEMAIPALPSGEEYRPEAAIVNYFGPSDMLGGHLDDMEADWSKPIVSISLGCRAIFLLGGNSREDLPEAMFLRTGDIVLMAGQARECFHGVPRIFTDDENADVSPLLEKLSSQGDLASKKYIESSRININIRQVY